MIVIGGKAGDFLGEYMAGEVILLLGMFSGKPDAPIAGMSFGTGMHGRLIYVHEDVSEDMVGHKIIVEPADKDKFEAIAEIVRDYLEEIGVDAARIMASDFMKFLLRSHRPYGNMYVPV